MGFLTRVIMFPLCTLCIQWFNDKLKIFPCRYGSYNSNPFVALLERVRAGKNVGKRDPICVLELLDLIIGDGKVISTSGINQLRI